MIGAWKLATPRVAETSQPHQRQALLPLSSDQADGSCGQQDFLRCSMLFFYHRLWIVSPLVFVPVGDTRTMDMGHRGLCRQHELLSLLDALLPPPLVDCFSMHGKKVDALRLRESCLKALHVLSRHVAGRFSATAC